MADFTPTAVANSSNFVSGTGDTTSDVLTDLLENRTEIYRLITSVAERFYGATAPSNYNTGTVWRDSANGITKVWSGTAWVPDTSVPADITIRNAILQGKIGTTGLAELFTGSASALTVKLNATDTPVIISWMDGNDVVTGEKNKIGTVTSDANTFWSSLPQSSTVYLYIELDGSTIQGGYSTSPPAIQTHAPTHAAGIDWINYNTGEVYNSNGSAWTKKYRVYVGTATTSTTAVTAVSVYPYSGAAIVTMQTQITTVLGKRDVKIPVLINPAANAISVPVYFETAATLYKVILTSTKATDSTSPPTSSSIFTTPAASTTIKVYGLSGSTITELDSNAMTTASLAHTLSTPATIPAGSWVFIKIVGAVNGVTALAAGLVVG